jgi:hypothetical protein
VSKETISQITDKVLEKMTDWCSRPLDGVYAAILVDAVMVKVRDGQVANRPIYTAIGVTLAGERDILGRRCRPHSEDPAVMPEEPVGGTEQMRMLSDPGTIAWSRRSCTAPERRSPTGAGPCPPTPTTHRGNTNGGCHCSRPNSA